MHRYLKDIIHNSIGAINPQFYFRHFFIGLIFPAVYILMPIINTQLNLITYLLFILNCLLYPYSRYVYQSVTMFIMGSRTILDNSPTGMFFTFITMAICWSLALLIAPFGLFYLYFKNKHQS